MHEFMVWAPIPRKVAVKIGEATYPMRGPDDRGWWSVAVEQAGPKTDYAFVVDDDAQAWPDPRSQWQPYGVHRASRVYDQTAFVWSDGGWQAPPLSSGVIYELHVGTFTPKGRWRNRLTGGVVAGGVISMKMLLKDFPVALLVREGVGAGENDA